ncbi:esterase/lipase family protein [Proteus mirabilis]
MSEKDSPGIGECQYVSYHLPKWLENGKIHWDDVQLQHKSLNAEAKCIVPPTKAIPVIFIPGIMGTNLKNSESKKVWRADLPMGVDTLSLLKLDGDERRNLLNVASTFVDGRGSIYPAKRSFISDDGNLFPSREERHWGEALYLSYGEFLDYFQHALIDDWQTNMNNMYLLQRMQKEKRSPNYVEYVEKQMPKGELRQLIGESLGDTHDSPLTQEELNHFENFLFPVHVFGYNWLEDNAVSAANLINYIDKVMETYKYKHGYGLAIEKVIIVTHSMGGLIARYASQVLGAKDKILGIVHGVIPDIGSPAAYRRMKTGAHKEGIAGKVLGQNAEELMSVLAFAPAPLQLLPTAKYPSNWLEIEGEGSYPQIDPFDEIYLRNDV